MYNSVVATKKSGDISSSTLQEREEALVSVVAPSLKLLEKMSGATEALKSFGIAYNLSIVAAHRSPKKTVQFASEIQSSKAEVIIAGGSGSAHLPGALASLTTIPVIGIPIKGETLDGIDSLYSMLQMPNGIPVATVGINAAFNAGILACQILCLKHPDLKVKLIKYREALEKEVEAEDAKLGSDNDKEEGGRSDKKFTGSA
jgi:phosphoribosylaminoimidazole carboxylase PurE protein